MNNHRLESIPRLIESIKTIGFLKRIFSWSSVVSLAIDASKESGTIDSHISELSDSVQEQKTEIATLKTEIKAKEKAIEELKTNITKAETKRDQLGENNTDLEKEITAFKKAEKQLQADYEKKQNQLDDLIKQMDADRIRLQQEREDEITQRFEDMKAQWQIHETTAEQHIKQIAKFLNIQYIGKDKVPFKGNPDNTLLIANEYVIFDAKSPQNDDLDNFPKYIRTQADSVKKYIKEKDVKKDIFLVIPSNTAHVISDNYLNMGDYNVFVITFDSLMPVIKSLQKIEEYEFAEALSPEDRDQICRILGRFAHATKRRIQVDQFFSDEFIDILTKAGQLPTEILEPTVTYEKSTKLNPPMEKAVKQIQLTELSKGVKRIKSEAEGKNISMKEDMSIIDSIPLRKDDVPEDNSGAKQ
ncbi:hypothetical protein H6504_00480 [Candidatus Woesearchaeota archaeon]|nr:hypothetical protein [Candidatus Woesearchaeota archaeon]